ncbi:hypothetical protein DFP72DRAFT_847975 [Ephemerocybe angulata]|uniref:Uncharacterized protein n=1 Tax=Ephemerocybe angulata TaxID=980116 RepID=A0A8H6HZ73_9AGAR|nr:hypothetical protein DFP72DRAFT_847975 [Tulosesus angulatus]
MATHHCISVYCRPLLYDRKLKTTFIDWRSATMEPIPGDPPWTPLDTPGQSLDLPGVDIPGVKFGVLTVQSLYHEPAHSKTPPNVYLHPPWEESVMCPSSAYSFSIGSRPQPAVAHCGSESESDAYGDDDEDDRPGAEERAEERRQEKLQRLKDKYESLLSQQPAASGKASKRSSRTVQSEAEEDEEAVESDHRPKRRRRH